MLSITAPFKLKLNQETLNEGEGAVDLLIKVPCVTKINNINNKNVQN
jgi:hypothetical protein